MTYLPRYLFTLFKDLLLCVIFVSAERKKNYFPCRYSPASSKCTFPWHEFSKMLKPGGKNLLHVIENCCVFHTILGVNIDCFLKHRSQTGLRNFFAA